MSTAVIDVSGFGIVASNVFVFTAGLGAAVVETLDLATTVVFCAFGFIAEVLLFFGFVVGIATLGSGIFGVSKLKFLLFVALMSFEEIAGIVGLLLVVVVGAIFLAVDFFQMN